MRHVAMLRKGWHQLWITGQWFFDKVGRSETLVGRGSLVGVVHEQKVEQS